MADPFNEALRVFRKQLDECEAIDHPTTMLVARLLTEFFNREEFERTGDLVAFPSQGRLKDMARIEERALRDQLGKLLGPDGVYTMKRGGRGHNNRYTACFFDRQSTAGQEERDDRQPGAVRPAVEHCMTGSPLPPTSETSDTSEGRPAGRPPHDRASRSTQESKREDALDARPRSDFDENPPLESVTLEIGNTFNHQIHGLCEIKVISPVPVVRDSWGQYRKIPLEGGVIAHENEWEVVEFEERFECMGRKEKR